MATNVTLFPNECKYDREYILENKKQLLRLFSNMSLPIVGELNVYIMNTGKLMLV